MRLVLIFVLAFAWAAPAAAQTLSVPLDVVTNDPVLDFALQPADTPLQCRIGDAAPAPCASPWRPQVSADGTYTYDVILGPLYFAGSFTVDRTPPQLAFTAGPADGSTQLEREATFTVLAADAHFDRVDCALDGAAVPCDVPLRGLGEGEHVLTATARDKAGNESRITRRFTVVAPTVIVDPRPAPAPAATPEPPRGDVLSSSAANPKLTVSAKRTRAYTRLTALKLTGVTAGTAVKVTCGCLKRALRATARSGTVTIRGLANRRLKPGTVVRVRAANRVFTVTIRATKAPRVAT